MALATQSGVARRSATQSDAEVGNGGKIEEVALNLLRVVVPEKKPRTRLNVLGKHDGEFKRPRGRSTD